MSWFPDESFVFEFRGSKVQEQAAAQLRRREVVDHLRVIRRSRYGSRFDLEDDPFEADEVDSILPSQGRPLYSIEQGTSALNGMSRNAISIT